MAAPFAHRARKRIALLVIVAAMAPAKAAPLDYICPPAVQIKLYTESTPLDRRRQETASLSSYEVRATAGGTELGCIWQKLPFRFH